MSDPLVSIVMPFWNEERYIADAIRSVLAQTHQNFELLLIDDQSSDQSQEICRGFDDPRIRFYCKDAEPKGLAASRNIGIGMAKGQYVLMQDADDISAPTRVEKQLAKAMECPGRRVVGTCIKRVQGAKEQIVSPPETHEEIVKGFTRLYNRTTIICGTMLAPRDILLRIPYRVQFKYMQDWDHILRLHESGLVYFYNCQEPLYTYFIRSKSVLFRSDWVEYNILIRHCQRMRRIGRQEFTDLRAFQSHLEKHPMERMKWSALKHMINLQTAIHQKLQVLHLA